MDGASVLLGVYLDVIGNTRNLEGRLPLSELAWSQHTSSYHARCVDQLLPPTEYSFCQLPGQLRTRRNGTVTLVARRGSYLPKCEGLQVRGSVYTLKGGEVVLLVF